MLIIKILKPILELLSKKDKKRRKNIWRFEKDGAIFASLSTEGKKLFSWSGIASSNNDIRFGSSVG
jgi:hypothetical protein